MVEHLDLTFHAMADATRRQLLQKIIEQPTTVLKLAEPFQFSLNAISKHLKVLEKAGLIVRSKKGREHHFSFQPQNLDSANSLMMQLKQGWEERLDALDKFLTSQKREQKMPANKLIVKKLIHATCADIFEAWSNPDMLSRWFYPDRPGWRAVSALDFKVGGHYRHEMINEHGASFLHSGTYKEIVPNKKIVFTWNSHNVHDTLVTVELEPKENKTELTLTHELLPNAEERSKHQEGWHTCLSKLTPFLTKQNYQCNASFEKPAADVFAALTSVAGLKGWWTQDCTIPALQLGSENVFRFGPTFTVMKIKEVIPNKKVVWECTKHSFVDGKLTHVDEWVGTKLIFQLEEKDRNTQLHFTQEGLTPWLECYSICENKWNYYLKESLKSYLETGVGGPYQA
ncbi:MAG: metalloregulator ArsR/SmtB family transcription factor [Parachlamydia sp.]|nr:metalloregulator ArsR/SmtB family transcription factor [Parachlamydia sp.]